MFQVYFTNHSYFSQDQFTSMEAALQHAQRCGFQAAIIADGHMIATWCPIGGTRYPANIRVF